jgi:hypothetical protein
MCPNINFNLNIMKKIIVLLLTLVIVACAKDSKFIEGSNLLYEYKKDTVFFFETIKDPSVWKTLKNTQEMFDACQIPQETLTKMTTGALIKTCLNHPLIGFYSAFNNELSGIDILVNNINILQELCKREDAAYELSVFFNANIYTLSTFDLGFVELLLASCKLPNTFSDRNIPILMNAVEKSLNEMVSRPKDYGYFSIKKGILLKNLIENKDSASEEAAKKLYNQLNSIYSTTKAPGDIIGYTDIYTIFGKYIQGLYREEMTASLRADADTYWTALYPGAQLLASSSCQYNCHAYAWSIADGGEICWIPSNEVSTFWTNDYYVPTTSTDASKIYYSSDHSAVPSIIDPGVYVSKWGNGPLMMHDPTYCPYYPSSLYYYKPYSTAFISLCISGILTPYINTPYLFVSPDLGSNITCVWHVEDSKGEIDGFTANSNGNTNVITFEKNTEFYLYCYYYFQGNYIGSASCCILAI